MSNYYEQKRINRLQNIQKWLRNESPLPLSKAEAEISLNWGVARSTAREYLDLLETADRIAVENEEVTYIEEEAEA